MGTRPAHALEGATAAAQHRVEKLRVELARKQQELDSLLIHSETLHPSAYAALQGQLVEEIEKLQAELKSLMTGEG
jgi:hypothetical protein